MVDPGMNAWITERSLLLKLKHASTLGLISRALAADDP
jgi:hypothetical protein